MRRTRLSGLGRGRAQRALWLALVWVTFGVRSASAGPPLLSDDPNTVGPGRVAAIFFGQSTGGEGASEALVPGLDVVVGVFEGVDLTAILAPNLIVVDTDLVQTTGLFQPGLKLAPLRGEHWRAAFSPGASIDTSDVASTTLTLPVEIEYDSGPFTVGADGGYVVAHAGRDHWFFSVYGGYALTPTLGLLVDAGTGETINGRDVEARAGCGVDWGFAESFHLLLGAGGGKTLSGGSERRWEVYAGVQWDFELWSPR